MRRWAFLTRSWGRAIVTATRSIAAATPRSAPLLALLLILLSPIPAFPDVTGIVIASRTELPGGYERVVGRILFQVDPRDPHNALIADITKAPVNAAGKVEFSSRFYALVPKGGGNHVALVDIVNRGRATVPNAFNVPVAGGNADLGDRFLAAAGFTVIGIGWEFDVAGNDAFTIEVPVAMENGKPITGIVSGLLTPNADSREYRFTDLAGYEPADPAGPDSRLTWRAHPWDQPQTVPRSQWHLSGNTVTASPALLPGRIYELSYRAKAAPLSGLGFLAVRDTVAWMKHVPDTAFPAQTVYAIGNSQSGRFLRTLVYEGFNGDEHDRQVFDAMMIHIAGASRLDVNRRWATPTSVGSYTATAYPFTDRVERDGVSGASEGLLDNPRARATQPKIFYTNTGVEYWGGGRSAALTHTTPDGAHDLAVAENVRSYFLAGAQHTPGAFPPVATAGQQRNNPLQYRWAMRALLVALDRWVREGVPPPESVVPQVRTATLVPVTRVNFPQLPGVQSPRQLKAGRRTANTLLAKAGAGTELPLFVPQVDSDGNEVAGIRLPDVAVPLATYTGWNFRKPADGGADQLVPLTGSFVPFPVTPGARARDNDPRRSVLERYGDRSAYLNQVRSAAQQLVSSRFLLSGDIDPIVERAGQTWDLVMGAASNDSR